MMSGQAVGLAGEVVSGAPRDSLPALDVAFSLDHAQRPDIVISDTGAYSDMMFGLCHPLGIEYRPELADMPDQRAWRTDRHADHGPLNIAARGRLDLPKIDRHWPDMLRVFASTTPARCAPTTSPACYGGTGTRPRWEKRSSTTAASSRTSTSSS